MWFIFFVNDVSKVNLNCKFMYLCYFEKDKKKMILLYIKIWYYKYVIFNYDSMLFDMCEKMFIKYYGILFDR